MSEQVLAKVENIINKMNAHMVAYYNSPEWNHPEYKDNNITENTAKLDVRRKFFCITKAGSIYAFIDKETGDIFKPASWKAPAKGVRGNVFSPNDGLEAFGFNCMGLVFVRYAKGY